MDIHNKTVSVIIPIFNTERYLDDCLESVIKQITDNIEVILVNDGSTDGSGEIIKKWKCLYPDIIVINQNNRGLSASRNIGFENSHGDYVCFIDSDDMLEQDALEELYSIAKKNNTDVLMYDASCFGDVPDPNYNFYDRSAVYQNFYQPMKGSEVINIYFPKVFCPSACLVFLSRSFLIDNQISFRDGVLYEDNEFHCKIMYYADRVFYTSKKLYKRRYRTDSITTSSFSWKKAIDIVSNANYIRAIDTNEEVFKKIAYDMMISTTNRIIKADLNVSSKKSKKYIKEIRRILGNNPTNYVAIMAASRVYEMFGEKYRHDLEYLRESRDAVLKELFDRIGLTNRKMCVGIYGTGQNSKKILHEYERLFGRIQARVFFIDSYIRESGYFRGYDIINVSDIERYTPDLIVLSSPKAREEMKKTMEEKYSHKYRLVEMEYVL